MHCRFDGFHYLSIHCYGLLIVHAIKTFLEYALGDIHEHLVNPPEKNLWKATVNKIVNKYWQNDNITSSTFYSTLEFLNMKISSLELFIHF